MAGDLNVREAEQRARSAVASRCLKASLGTSPATAVDVEVEQLGYDFLALADLARRLASELFGPWPQGRSRVKSSQDKRTLRERARAVGCWRSNGKAG